MATRSNIRLTDACGNALWLYRHWDGYPACNGVDICRAIKRILAHRYQDALFAPLANELLAQRYDATSHEPVPRPVYEVTTCEHGDIEWLYDIRCKGRSATVTVTERSFRNGKKVLGMMALKEFRSFCAKDLAGVRQRIRQRNRAA